MQIFKNGQRIDTPDKPETALETQAVKRTVEVLTGSEKSGSVQNLAPVPEISGYASIEEYKERNR